jgi:solute carrier family 25 (mitochondrial oxoglutarate transporter), member 11
MVATVTSAAAAAAASVGSSSSAGRLIVKMIIAAFSGMGAATVCHPLDVIRVQMQTEGSQFRSSWECASNLWNERGLMEGLYAGIGAAYLRQWLYGSCRIGIYAFLLERAQTISTLNDNLAASEGVYQSAPAVISLSTKLWMGCTSGGIGSFVGTPAELALVRMSGDSKLPPSERRNYKSVGDCILRIIREEGFFHLWRGAQVTVLRAMVLSACVLGITSEVKVRLTQSGIFGLKGELWYGFPLLFVATLISSFVANIFSNPFDVVKSRTQNQRVEKDGSTKYKSMIDCFIQILRDEGVLTLWSGFTPAFLKLAPYTIISLILTEKITQFTTGKSAL